MRISEFIAERFEQLGICHVFGVGGANIEDMFAAVQRRRPELRMVLCKHEHAAGTAADAYGRLRGLGAVMVTSGGGAMNLVHALAEAHASEVPLLAVVGEPPTPLQGSGAFQDTSGKNGTVDAQAVLQAAAGHCTRVARVEEVRDAFEEALAATCSPRRGPAVLLLAKDLQSAVLPPRRATPAAHVAALPRLPDLTALQQARGWLKQRPIVIIAGPEVVRARAQDQLAALAARVDARVATTPDARDAFDNHDLRFLGVSGAMGHAAVAQALKGARLVLLAGSTLPLLARQGMEAPLQNCRLLCVGSRPSLFAPAGALHVDGELSSTLRALAEEPAEERATMPTPRAPPASMPSDATCVELRTSSALRIVDRLAPAGSTILVDAGNIGASSVHHVRAPRDGHWLIAMGMGGMGYTFGAATGAALATGERCVVLAGDGAFFMHGMEIHTAIEHSLPITYLLFDNRAHGMCLVRERLLLGENAGYNGFSSRAKLGAGLAAMFPGLDARDCESAQELEQALARALSTRGPSVLCIQLPEVEIPPFSAFQELAPDATTVTREAD